MSEVQKKGEIIMTYLNDQYHDRGMKKWAGFFLSEHTAEQEKIQKGFANINAPKPRMSEQEIGEVLQLAIVKNKPVAIQIEAVNNDGRYYDDIIGHLKGSDSLGIYVGNEKVHYDEIRNIQIYDQVKWSSL